MSRVAGLSVTAIATLSLNLIIMRFKLKSSIDYFFYPVTPHQENIHATKPAKTLYTTCKSNHEDDRHLC